MLKPKGMMVWRDVPGYEGLYQISNHGDVRNVKTTLLNDTNIHLINIDKSIQSISRKKLFNSYWKKDEQYKGAEQWRRLDFYEDYFVSNFNEVKRIRKFVINQQNMRVTLFNGKGKRKNMSVLEIFLNAFPPGEVEINNEDKTINYIKKNENISDTSVARTA